MAARRPGFRRRRSSRMRFSQQGRQGLWFRQESFSPSALNVAVGLEGDSLILPSDWERLVQPQTQPRSKGGARLERSFCQFSMLVSYDATTTFQIIPAIEVLNYAQNTRAGALPTSQASYSSRLGDSRVLWHRMYPANIRSAIVDPTVVQVQYAGSWESRSKCRLTDNNISLVFNSFFDHGGADIIDVSTLVVYTGYISTP